MRAELSFRVLKGFRLGDRALLAVARLSADAQLEVLTFLNTRDDAYINRQRWGRLLVGR